MMKTTKAMRDNWRQIFSLLNPNDVYELCDDIDTLESRCAELEALVKGHEFTVAYQKVENAWQAEMLERAEEMIYGIEGAIYPQSTNWISDLEKGPEGK